MSGRIPLARIRALRKQRETIIETEEIRSVLDNRSCRTGFQLSRSIIDRLSLTDRVFAFSTAEIRADSGLE